MNKNNTKTRILIVEDEKLICWSLENALTNLDYEVITVFSGEKAIERLYTEKFDFVITDMKLPNINGFEVATAAKTFSPNIRVILISAESNPISEIITQRSAIDCFIEKPFDLKFITSLIKDMIENNNVQPHSMGAITQSIG